MAKVMYKVVKVLKNGCRVSPLLPKSSGMRKTYQANGKAISVDEGWVFNDWFWAKEFYHNYSWVWCGQKCKWELWECDIEERIVPLQHYIKDVGIMNSWYWNQTFLSTSQKETITQEISRLYRDFRKSGWDFEKFEDALVNCGVIYYYQPWYGGLGSGACFAKGITLVRKETKLY